MDCGSAAHFGCMGRGPLLSCLMTTHAIVGSTFPSVCAWRARAPHLVLQAASVQTHSAWLSFLLLLLSRIDCGGT
jgi:hypothetical protein